MFKTCYLVVIGLGAIALAGLWCPTTYASEGGVSTYRLGFNDLNSADLPAPGTTTMKSLFLYQDGELIADKVKEPEAVDTKTRSYIDMLLVTHVTDLTLLGARYGFAGLVQMRVVDRDKGSGPIGSSIALSENSTVGGFGDSVLYPVLLNWGFGRVHLLSALVGYLPTGSYDKKRMVNVGSNRWAIEPRLGMTWKDVERGRQVSILTGYTVNSRNGATDYRSGDEFHADFAASQSLPYGISVGASGYALQQTTPDTGTGALYGGFRQRVIGLGPLVSETFKVAGHPLCLTFKYDFEVFDQNRSSGNALWFNAALTL